MQIRRSRASASATIARYRASKMCRGNSVRGNSVVSGSGKIGTASGAATASANGRQRRHWPELLEAPRDGACELGEGARGPGLRTMEGDGRPFVPRDPSLRLERDPREQRHAVLLADPVAAGVTEDGRV